MFAVLRLRSIPLAIAIGFPLGAAVSDAAAMGFGRVANTTQLGQQLDFAATVQIGHDETLTRECVDAEVVSGETRLPRGQLRVTLEAGAEANTRRVRVTSFTPIDEPVVTVQVTVGCNDKVSRKFVAFVDPPAVDAARSAMVEPVRLPPQRVDSAVAPVLAMVQPETEAAASAASSSGGAAGSGSTATSVALPSAAPFTDAAPPPAAAETPRRPRSSKPAVLRPSEPTRFADAAPPPPRAFAGRVAAAAPARGGSKLRLDAAPDPQFEARAAAKDPASTELASLATAATPASAPTPVASPPPTADDAVLAAAAAVAASSEALLAERQRVRQLEDGLARLAVDARSTRQALDRLQARLDTAESQRHANPLVYGLIVFGGIAALAAAALARRLLRSRAARPWWQAADGPTRALTATMAAWQPSRDEAAAADEPGSAPGTREPAAFDGEPASAVAIAMDAAASPPRPLPTISPDTLPMGQSEIAVEELIDLEQQADFFVVLGQEDAAIDLLTSHLRSHGGISPLPYLKLLEIHRRRDEREDYERVRGRFNRRFNAHAPAWDLDLQLGRDLGDHPLVVQRLQTLWERPAEVMKALDAALFRRGDPRRDDSETFDLPAYRELLLLYSVARDLADQATAPAVTRGGIAVDFLLPLDEPAVRKADAARAATAPTQPLDLDVSLPEPSPDRSTPPATPLQAMSVEEFDTRAALLEFGESAVRVRELARAE